MAGSLDMKVKAVPDPRVRTRPGHFKENTALTALDKAMVKWAGDAVVQFKEATPVEDTGAMRRGWTWSHLPAQNAVEVRNYVKHALWVIGGTGQQTGGFIYPTTAKFLRFMAKQGPHAGHMVSLKRVRGQKPNPALNAIIDRLAGEAAVDLHQAGVSVLRSLTGLEDGA